MAKDSAEEKDAASDKGGKKKMIIMAVVALLVLGGVYKFVLAKPAPADAEEVKPVAGPVLVIDPVNINLADGALLRFGMTLQLTEAAAKLHEPADGGKALDSAIAFFSGEKISVLQSKKTVAKLKAELLSEIEERYSEHSDDPKVKPESLVMDLYFTTFVVQAATS